MPKCATALLLVVAGSIAAAASAQTPADASPGQLVNPTQQQITTPEHPVPVFRATLTRHSTPAINYRPRRGKTDVGFRATPLMPGALGKARVEGHEGYFEIEANVDGLDPASRFGREYLTYVLWAITPEGRATNLGEIQLDDRNGRVEVTTELQTFGLVVTAEPYFAVSHPSDVVVLENVAPHDNKTKVEVIQANFELLKRGTYLMDQDAAQRTLTALDAGAPLDLAQARNAVLLAGLAGADRYAPETYAKAAQLFAEAEVARQHPDSRQSVTMIARQAVQTAEDARLIALRKREAEYIAEQRAGAEQREAAALARARQEESLRQQAEAEKERALREAEAEKEELRRQADMEKAKAESALVEAEREKQVAEAVREAAEREKAAAQEALAAAGAARAAAEASAEEVRAVADRAARERTEMRDRLREELSVIMETRETARGLIVNLSDVLFDPGSAELTDGAREKLARVAGVVLSYPGLQVAIEGHTDSVGPASFNQALSETRAASVRAYLVQQGISPTAVATAGFGESHPVVSNDTASGRQQNRRVELIISGEAIKTNTTMTIQPRKP